MILRHPILQMASLVQQRQGMVSETRAFQCCLLLLPDDPTLFLLISFCCLSLFSFFSCWNDGLDLLPLACETCLVNDASLFTCIVLDASCSGYSCPSIRNYGPLSFSNQICCNANL